jgi:hypothetical protein
VAALSETSGAAAGSASDWISSMRNKNPAVKAKDAPPPQPAAGRAAKKGAAAKKAPAAAAKDAYSAADLGGLNVAHSAAAFAAGSSTILTLADAEILETGAGGAAEGLNEDGGINLENANLAEEERRRKLLKKKREVAAHAQGGAYDDDEFEELGGSGVPSSSKGGGLLNKYDDDEGGAGFTLGGGGAFDVDPDKGMSDFDRQAAGKATSLTAE